MSSTTAEEAAQPQQQGIHLVVTRNVPVVENAPACCTRSGEVSNCKCCQDKPFNWVLLTYGLLVLLAFIFACTSTGTIVWATFELKEYDDYLYSRRTTTHDFYVGLWSYLRDGGSDDDTGDVEEAPDTKRKVEDYIGINWEAYEANRATTIITLLLTFPIALYYIISSMCGRCRPVEYVSSIVLGVLFILALSGSSNWIHEFDNQFYFDDDAFNVDSEVICGSGCSLQMFNAWYMLILAILLFAFAFCDCCCCPEKKAVPPSEVEVPVVADAELGALKETDQSGEAPDAAT